MKKINWKLVLVILGIVIFSSVILFYKIGAQYMWTDEVFSFNAAKMILEKGVPLYDSGLNYARSLAYNYLMAGSMKLFGINEFGSRVINVPFAIGTALLSFFFIKDILKKSKHNIWIALSASLLYVTANFTIASVRETRMYAMTVFLFTLMVIAFYRGFISTENTETLKIKNFEFRYNLIWIAIFILSFFLGYSTQPITIIFGPSLLAFYVAHSILRKNKESLLFSLLILIMGFLAVYYIYNTFNIYSVFLSLSPNWAMATPKFFYYPILLVRNFPGIAILSPLILYSLVKYKNKLDIYLFITFITYVIFISLQKAQSERYLEPVLPLLPMLLTISIYRFYLGYQKKSKTFKNIFLSIIILIISIPQVYLLQKELREIDTYTSTSISIYKKMQFNDVFKYLDTKDLSNTTVIADYHSAYTLYAKGYKVDYILVTTTQNTLDKGRDIYMNIPYLVYDDSFFGKVSQMPSKLVIVRDWQVLPGIEKVGTQVPQFTEPRVYE